MEKTQRIQFDFKGLPLRDYLKTTDYLEEDDYFTHMSDQDLLSYIDNDHNTCLHVACFYQRRRATEYLIDRFQNNLALLIHANSSKATLMHILLGSKEADLVSKVLAIFLATEGVDYLARQDHKGQTVIQKAFANGYDKVGAELVDKVLKAGRCDILHATDVRGDCLLHTIIRSCDFPRIPAYLYRLITCMPIESLFASTELAPSVVTLSIDMASFHQSDALCRTIVSRISPQTEAFFQQDSYGRTYLHRAVIAKLPAVVLLICGSMDGFHNFFNIKDKDGNTALDLFYQEWEDADNYPNLKQLLSKYTSSPVVSCCKESMFIDNRSNTDTSMCNLFGF